MSKVSRRVVSLRARAHRRLSIALVVLTTVVAAMLVPTTGSAQTVAAPRPVFGDSFAAGFGYNPWNGTNNVANSSPVHGGTTSISSSFGSFSGIYISVANGESLAPYASLRLWVNGGSAGLTNGFVSAQGAGASGDFPIPAVAANQWAQVTVPLASIINNTAGFDAAADRYLRVFGSGSTTSTVFLDDIELVPGSSATTTTTSATTTSPQAATTTQPGSTTSQVNVLTSTAVASGWRIVVADNFSDASPSGGSITFTPGTEKAIRVFGPWSGYNTAEFMLGTSMAGKTISAQPYIESPNLAAVGGALTATVGADGKATFTIPTTSFTLLYLTGINAASVVMTSIVAKSTSAPVTTVTPGSTGPTNVLSPTAVASGWRIVVADNFSDASPSGGSITFTPGTEKSIRVFGPWSGFNTAEFMLGTSMAGKTISAQPYIESPNLAAVGGALTATVAADGKATFTIPTSGFTLLYLTGINAPSVVMSSIIAKNVVVTTPSTTVAPGPASVINVLSPTAVASGWRIVVADNFSDASPSGGSITFTPGTEKSIRVFGPWSGYNTAEFMLGTSMAGKTISAQPFNESPTLAAVGGALTATVAADGKATFTIPTSGFTLLYLTGINASSVVMTSIVAKNVTVTTPTTIPGGTVTTTNILSPTAVGSGWRIAVADNFSDASPSGGSITFTPGTEKSIRVFGPWSGFNTAEFMLGTSMAGKTITAQPFNESPTLAAVGGALSATVAADGKATFTIPTTSFTLLYLTGINAPSVVMTSIVAQSSGGTGPTTTVPGGSVTAVDVLTSAAIASGWRIVVADDFSNASVSGGSITFTPGTEKSIRVFGPWSGFNTAEFMLGTSMAGKTISAQPFNESPTLTAVGGALSATVGADGKATFTIPTTSFTLLYLTGINAPSVVMTGIVAKSTATTTGPGTNPTGTNNPCPGRGGPLRVWPIGDSLTVGGYGTGASGASAMPFQDSFRYELYRKLVAGGFASVQFRGHLGLPNGGGPGAPGWGGNLPAGVSDEFSHSGVGGETIPYFNTNIATFASVGPVDPDVIILNIGTNGGTPDELTTLVAKLQRLSPYSVIVVGSLPRRNGETTSTGARDSLRVRAQALGNASTSDRVMFADVYGSMNTQVMVAADYADETHYNVSGGTKFANALYPTVLAALNLASSSRCVQHPTLVDGGAFPDPTTSVDLAVFTASPLATASGYNTSPAMTNATAPVSLTIAGTASAGSRAIRISKTSTNPVTVRVAATDGTRTYATQTLGAGTSTYSIPFTLPLAAGAITITLTSTTTYTLNAVTLMNRAFVTVTTPAEVQPGATIPITIDGVWDPGVANRTFVRVQLSGTPNDCTSCGQTVAVSAAGTVQFAAVEPGSYKAVMFTNAPGETIGISRDFDVLRPAAQPAGTKIPVYFDSLSSAFSNWSWAANTLANTSPARGTNSIAFEADSWQGISFHADEVNASTTGIEMWINGGATGNQQLRIVVSRGTTYLVDKTVTVAAGWQQVTYPYSTNATAGEITVTISANTAADQPTVYVDDINLFTGTTTTPTTLPATTSSTTSTTSTTRPATTTSSSTTTRPATTTSTTRVTTSTTRPASTTTPATTTTRPASTTTRATTTRVTTTTRPLTSTTRLTTTTLPASTTTTRATTSTTRLATTTSTTTSTLPPTTLPPTTLPPTTAPPTTQFAPLERGYTKQVMVYNANTPNPGVCVGVPTYESPYFQFPIRADAWNQSRVRVTATNNAQVYVQLLNPEAPQSNSTITYTIGTVQTTVNMFSVGGAGAPIGWAYDATVTQIPAGAAVTAASFSVQRVCNEQAPTQISIYFDVPNSAGVITEPVIGFGQNPNPPVTTIPGGPTTTVPAVGGPVPIPASWFSTTNNYLKNRSRHDAGNVLACLGSDAGASNVVPSNCVQDLTFRSSGAGYKIIRGVLSNERCLMITRNRSPLAFDPTPGNGNALSLEWRVCTDVGGPDFLDDTFSFSGQSNTGGSTTEVWVKMRPTYNYAGWNNPCVRLWDSASAVLQFTCQPDNDQYFRDELWAPIERFPSGPITPSGPPAGAKLFTIDNPTPIERFTDLACLSEMIDGSFIYLLGDSTQCESFNPKWEDGGWKLYQLDSPGFCLGVTNRVGPGIAKVSCSTQAAWLDQPVQSDGLSFPLRWVNSDFSLSNFCMGGQSPVQLVRCDESDPTQYFYDFPSLCRLLGFEDCFWDHWTFKWAVGSAQPVTLETLAVVAGDLVLALTIGGCVDNGVLSRSCAFDLITVVPVAKVGKATKLIRAVKVADDGGDAAKVLKEVPDLQNALDEVIPVIRQNKLNGDAFRDAVALAERAVDKLVKIEQSLRTSSGLRRHDVVIETVSSGRKVAIETKIGYIANTPFIKEELAKDLEILAAGTGGIKSVTWRFGISPTTGKGGPSKPLLAALRAAADKGIDVVCDPGIVC
jgi:hypothetical protein